MIGYIYQPKIFGRSLQNFWLVTQKAFVKNTKRALKIYLKSYKRYINIPLTLKDFEWVFIDKKKRIGYYSHKVKNCEICIDEHYPYWVVSVANKYEEVLEDITVPDREEALREANIYHKRIIYGLR